MRTLRSNRYGMISLCVLAAVLGGCFGSSHPSRFYTLSSLRGPEPTPQARSDDHRNIVAIGPLAIPDYLDRPEIVTRAGQNEMRVNAFQRWAGPLDDDLSRTLIEDLSVLLPVDRFSVMRWNPAQHGAPIVYRVMVDVTRFDAVPGAVVFLDADWTVYGNEREILLNKRSTVSGKVNGTEYADLVAAMSKTIEDLSRAIAAAVAELEQEAPEKQEAHG